MAENIDINQVIEQCKKVLTQEYLCFDGRMSLREYWLFALPVYILGFVPVVGQVLLLALLLPTIGATTRRLHDTGKTGWLQLIGLICPPIGSIIVLLMCLPDGEPGENKYGPAPAGTSDSAE